MSKNRNNLQTEIERLGGNVITLDLKSDATINPFNPLHPINKGTELTVFGVSIGTLEKLKEGGFRDLGEVQELVSRFDIGKFEHRHTFENWCRKDGTKLGLIRLIDELGL